MKENTKENIVIFSLLLSLKINEENKREREGKVKGNFIKLTLSSSPSLQFTQLSLRQWLWLPITIDHFNSHHHYSNHFPMPPKTNPLLVHKFPWLNCILQIQSVCLNPCLHIRYGLISSLLTSHLDILQMQVFSQSTLFIYLFFHFWKSQHPNFVDMENLMLLFVIGFECFSCVCFF